MLRDKRHTQTCINCNKYMDSVALLYSNGRFLSLTAVLLTAIFYSSIVAGTKYAAQVLSCMCYNCNVLVILNEIKF
jgi:hypothetical protein